MVLRQLVLPKEGGGSLRRFVGIRARLFRDQWKDSRPLRGPVSLFDFRRRDDAADVRESLDPNRKYRGLFPGWRASDDGVIGGFSSSGMEFHDGSAGAKNDADSEGGKNIDNPSTPASSPFLRWSGTLCTKINHQSHLARNVTRSGFAAIRSPEYPYAAPLGNKYRALEICCRTDGRTYAVNLHVESYFPEDVYQGFIVGGGGQERDREEKEEEEDYGKENNSGDEKDDTIETNIDGDENKQQTSSEPERPAESLDVREHLRNRQNLIRTTRITSEDDPISGHPPLGFRKFILPFRDFALTSRGRMRHAQRDLDGGINIESIGFTLMDGKDGDFTFDLVSLRAVNVLEGEVVPSLEDEAREEEFREGLRSPMSSVGEEEERDIFEADLTESEKKIRRGKL
mmetsp:Transcript_17184/g.41206  ORF Transcript_17184/g.41206 Transcript_17184/m.41206 type:complete len:400 (-) Transcript_17184:50-1249(-)